MARLLRAGATAEQQGPEDTWHTGGSFAYSPLSRAIFLVWETLYCGCMPYEGHYTEGWVCEDVIGDMRTGKFEILIAKRLAVVAELAAHGAELSTYCAVNYTETYEGSSAADFARTMAWQLAVQARPLHRAALALARWLEGCSFLSCDVCGTTPSTPSPTARSLPPPRRLLLHPAA